MGLITVTRLEDDVPGHLVEDDRVPLGYEDYVLDVAPHTKLGVDSDGLVGEGSSPP